MRTILVNHHMGWVAAQLFSHFQFIRSFFVFGPFGNFSFPSAGMFVNTSFLLDLLPKASLEVLKSS